MKRLILTLLLLILLLCASAFAGTPYYIGPNGDYLTWELFKQAHPTPSTGDDVYFECGYTFTPTSTMYINWEGAGTGPTVSDYATVGAYYYDGSRHIGVSGARPIISGSNWTVPRNTTFPLGDPNTVNDWTGLIEVNSKDYINIKDLHIYRSGFYGIRITGSSYYGGYTSNSAYYLVENCLVEYSYSGGIGIVRNDYNYGTITGNEVSYSSVKRVYTSDSTANIVNLSCQHPNNIIENNYVHHGWMEGIGSYNVVHWHDGIGYMTVRDNLVYCNRSVGIYLGASSFNEVYDNVVLGCGEDVVGTDVTGTLETSGWGASGQYLAGRWWNRAGIGISVEDQQNSGEDCADNEVYNNLVAGISYGIYFSTQKADQDMLRNLFYHNTVINNRINFYTGNSFVGTWDVTGSTYKDNLSFCSPEYVGLESPRCRDFYYNATAQATKSWTALGFTSGYNGYTGTLPNYMLDADTNPDPPIFGIISPLVASSIVWQNLNDETVQGAWEYARLHNQSKAKDKGIVLSGYTTDYEGKLWGSAPVDIGFIASTSGGSPPVTAVTSPSGPQEILAEGSVSFSGTCTDPDGDNVSALWDFDGGATNYPCASASTPLTCNAGSTQFNNAGSYNVRLICTDANTLTSQQSVGITVGTPPASSYYLEYNFEDSPGITDNEGTLGATGDLTNNGSIANGGTEPNPPGYGTEGAIFDGSTQYFSLANASIGNAVCNGTDTDCTIIIGLNADAYTSVDYLWSLYDASANNDRKIALVTYNGQAQFNWSTDGTAWDVVTITGHTFGVNEDMIMGLSIDFSTHTYTFTVKDVSTGNYYTKTEADEALVGESYNTSSTPLMTIGRRSDAAGWFDGTIYFVYVSDDVMTLAEMKNIIDNTTPSANSVSRCYLGEDKTYKANDTITVICETSDLFDLAGDSSATFTLNDDDSTVLTLDTSNGDDLTQFSFSGTIAANDFISGDAEIDGIDADAITLNSSTFYEADTSNPITDTIPIAGAVGSIPYESDGYIDAITPSVLSSRWVNWVEGQNCANATSSETVTYTRGQRARLQVTISASSLFNDGAVSELAMSAALDAGGPLTLTPQSAEYGGWGTPTICFESEVITDGMTLIGLENNMVHGGEIVRSGDTIIENAAGVEISQNGSNNYDVGAASNIAWVDGSAKTRTGRDGTGSYNIER